MSTCMLSTRIEAELFVKTNKEEIPGEPCPICLEPLKENSKIGCCGTYAKKLKCGHFVHVSCHINKNPDLRQCSVCRAELTDISIYFKILKAIEINKFPIHYQMKLIQVSLTQDDIIDLEKYGLNFTNHISYIVYLGSIKNDEYKLKEEFRKKWVH
jgi:hypothetical protein